MPNPRKMVLILEPFAAAQLAGVAVAVGVGLGVVVGVGVGVT